MMARLRTAAVGQSVQGLSSARTGVGTMSASQGLLGVAWRWLQSRRRAQTRAGRLRVAESVSLGEKRFVALIELDGRQFLVGGGATGISLLAQLEPPAARTETSSLDKEVSTSRAFREILRQSASEVPAGVQAGVQL